MAPKDLRTLGWLWFVSAVCLIVLTPFLAGLVSIVPACTFRELTGVPCFTCGSTRAFLSLKSGEVLQALSHNPLAALGTTAFIMGGLFGPWILPPTAKWKLHPKWQLMVVAVFVVNWIYLIVRAVLHNELVL